MTNARLFIIALLGILVSYYSMSGWRPAVATLNSQWEHYAQPQTNNVFQPNPELVNPEWKNLNGTWDFGFTDSLMVQARPELLPQKILVPFPVESALSGVQDSGTAMWYKRSFELPEQWQNTHTILHFERVIGKALLFINDHFIATEDGNLHQFAIDITDYILPDNSNEIWVGVESNADSTSGIIETVWLEPIPENFIEDIQITTKKSVGGVEITASVCHARKDDQIIATIHNHEQTLVSVQGKPNKAFFVQIPSVENPSDAPSSHYNVKVKLERLGQEIDSAETYFGLQSLSLNDVKDIPSKSYKNLPKENQFQSKPINAMMNYNVPD